MEEGISVSSYPSRFGLFVNAGRNQSLSCYAGLLGAAILGQQIFKKSSKNTAKLLHFVALVHTSEDGIIST